MWPAYVINLAANTERLERSARQLDAQGIAWRRIDGINGWQLTADEIAGVYDAAANARRGKHPLVAPEIGCYLSHILAWRTIAAGDAPGGFVFEDDFAAAPTLRGVLDLVSADQGPWDMVKFFSFDPRPRLIGPRRLGGDLRLGIAYRVPSCTIAYGITRDAAARLAQNSVPFFRAVDEDLKFFWENGLRIAVVTPAPIAKGEDGAVTGTVHHTRRKAAAGLRRSPLARAWMSLTYQVDYQTRLYVNRRRGIGV